MHDESAPKPRQMYLPIYTSRREAAVRSVPSRLTLHLRSSTALLRQWLRVANQLLGIGLRGLCGCNRLVDMTALGCKFANNQLPSL